MIWDKKLKSWKFLVWINQNVLFQLKLLLILFYFTLISLSFQMKRNLELENWNFWLSPEVIFTQSDLWLWKVSVRQIGTFHNSWPVLVVRGRGTCDRILAHVPFSFLLANTMQCCEFTWSQALFLPQMGYMLTNRAHAQDTYSRPILKGNEFKHILKVRPVLKCFVELGSQSHRSVCLAAPHCHSVWTALM